MGDGPTADSATARQERSPSDYAGAIYGSLLAASVVAGTGPGQQPGTPCPIDRPAARDRGGVLARPRLRGAARRAVGRGLLSLKEYRACCEAGVADRAGRSTSRGRGGIGVLLGLSDAGAAWLALAVAVGSQLGWALYVAAKAGATRGAWWLRSHLPRPGSGDRPLKAALTHRGRYVVRQG